jgi:hypothetical protein
MVVFLSTEEKVAGGENFPNTFGQAVSDNLNETSSCNPLDSVSKTIPSADFTILNTTPNLAKKTSHLLTKTTASSELVKISATSKIKNNSETQIDSSIVVPNRDTLTL